MNWEMYLMKTSETPSIVFTDIPSGIFSRYLTRLCLRKNKKNIVWKININTCININPVQFLHKDNYWEAFFLNSSVMTLCFYWLNNTYEFVGWFSIWVQHNFDHYSQSFVKVLVKAINTQKFCCTDFEMLKWYLE